jgi:hypothetical protein
MQTMARVVTWRVNLSDLIHFRTLLEHRGSSNKTVVLSNHTEIVLGWYLNQVHVLISTYFIEVDL